MNKRKKSFKDIPLKDIAGLITFPSYKLVFRDERDNLPLTEEEARGLMALWGRVLPQS